VLVKQYVGRLRVDKAWEVDRLAWVGAQHVPGDFLKVVLSENNVPAWMSGFCEVINQVLEEQDRFVWVVGF